MTTPYNENGAVVNECGNVRWWANVQRDSYQSVVAANNYLWILMNIFGNTVITSSPDGHILNPLWRGWKGGALRVAPNEIKVSWTQRVRLVILSNVDTDPHFA